MFLRHVCLITFHLQISFSFFFVYMGRCPSSLNSNPGRRPNGSVPNIGLAKKFIIGKTRTFWPPQYNFLKGGISLVWLESSCCPRSGQPWLEKRTMVFVYDHKGRSFDCRRWNLFSEEMSYFHNIGTSTINMDSYQ